ncbi:alpha/beta hydrolase [Pseudomaricurvus hydrocarbonicus]|nr:alpha/beta fold hydrolase [Aestuariicella hydrocarbonica]
MSAEVQQGLAEDVYLLKPNNSLDHSVELALTHLSPLGESETLRSQRPALVLIHGCYQNRRLWWTDSGPCLAKELVSHGIDVWLMELRGHGVSPVNQCYEDNTLEDYARYDLPAVDQFVAEHSRGPVNWLGYGTGAGALLASIALHSLPSESTGLVMGMGVPFFKSNWSRIPGVSTLLAAGRGKTDSHLGPESESMSFLQGLAKESQWFARRGVSVGVDLWRELTATGKSIHWLCSDECLNQLDDGFNSLQTQGLLHTVLDEPVLDDEVAQEHIVPSLTNAEKVDSLAGKIVQLLDTGGASGCVSPTGKTSSVTRRLQAGI